MQAQFDGMVSDVRKVQTKSGGEMVFCRVSLATGGDLTFQMGEFDADDLPRAEVLHFEVEFYPSQYQYSQRLELRALSVKRRNG